MTDPDTQSTPAVPVLSPPASLSPTDQNGTPLPHSGWLDRLREAFGFRAVSLRQNLEEALSRDNALDAAFSPEERAMIRNILRLRETRVDDVMVPRADILAVPHDVTLTDLLRIFENSGHSRMPVYRETLDDALGMVHIKDLMTHLVIAARQGADTEAGPLDLGAVDLARTLEDAQLLRPVLFVPPSMPATDLLAKMQAARTQMALVIDEYGGTDGLVSIEDLVETIVGEIDDEHDETDDPLIVAADDGSFLADARADLDTVSEAIPGFVPDDFDDEADTLGGLVFALLGRIPASGEVVTSEDLPGFTIEVLEADPRRLRSVRIIPAPGGAGRARPAEPRPADA
ncbi:hemolysin family protein [Chthonobacter rhizosphaerae]|uniref:hemolysin family protein n=1 Tax=Chthonobacter rhizosphaerae TaxID=2735553 RepID=UPI0015EFAE59|nr:hemolysin family protein [Chthonobacter rhizosphaerae]